MSWNNSNQLKYPWFFINLISKIEILEIFIMNYFSKEI
jgi:hypothetical protein